MGLFGQQVAALLFKDAVVLRRRWISTIFKCFLLPTAYGIFLACIQFFFSLGGSSGNGTPIEIFPLEQHFNPSYPFVWVDKTNGSTSLSPNTIMDRITSNFSPAQKAAVRKADSVTDMLSICTSNFVEVSDCYVGLSFDVFSPANTTSPAFVNYTIWGDGRINEFSINHESDMETKVLPLKWALDKTIIELTTGTVPPTPQEWPVSNDEGRISSSTRRAQFLSSMQFFGALPFTVAFLGSVYRISGTVAVERSTSLTAHMTSMGGSYAAQVLSWHLTTSLTFLPTWVALAIGWKLLLFTQTNFGLILLVNLFTGVALVGWSIVAAIPFRSSPQLAAAVVTAAAVGAAVGPVAQSEVRTSVSIPLCIFFPSAFYGYFLRAMSNFEAQGFGLNLGREDEHSFITVSTLFIPVAVLSVVWPILAVAVEHFLYGVRRTKPPSDTPLPPGIALRLSGIRKTFKSLFKSEVVAIDDLSFDVPKDGVYILLGPNGAGKSTTLAILGNITSATSGYVQFSDDLNIKTAPIGIVPQHNTLHPELTCRQTLRFWETLKRTRAAATDEELTQLLRDCDLIEKADCRASTLSGGQQRKLQLAVGLVGGSEFLLIDECTSGVDPISRRAIWKALSIHKAKRTILFTTHFLDEAEYLADHIAVLAAPGKLIASGTPVALKNSMGTGYSVAVKFVSSSPAAADTTLAFIRQSAPEAEMKLDHQRGYVYSLKTKNTTTTATVLRQLELNKSRLGIDSYEAISTTIEDIFLNLVKTEEERNASQPTDVEEIKEGTLPGTPASRAPLRLASSRHASPFSQATTIFFKRILLLRTKFLLPIAALVIGIVGSWAPLGLIDVQNRHSPQCSREVFPDDISYALDLSVNYPYGDYYSGPASLTSMLASSPDLWPPPSARSGTRSAFVNQPDLATFTKAVDIQRQNFTFSSAIYADFETKEVRIAWTGGPYGARPFNLYSNLAMRTALRAQGVAQNTTLVTRIGQFPRREVESNIGMLFVIVLGIVMAAYTSFAAIHITEERTSNVQAMMLSNGLANPLGLWLGHLLYDCFVTTFVSIVVVAIYAGQTPTKVQYLGPLWVVLWLYGLVGTLYAYLIAMFFKKPLAAFATCFLTQAVIANLYLMGYIIGESAAPKLQVPSLYNNLQYGLGIVFPLNNVMRAGLLSLNLYTFMCNTASNTLVSGADIVTMNRYGSPILYLLIWLFALIFVLAQLETNFSIANLWRRRDHSHPDATDAAALKLANIEHAIATIDEKDPLQVYSVTKFYGKMRAVDNVSFSIPSNTILAMLGPNGAGKTTTFDIMRGKLRPDKGDVIMNGSSILRDLKTARLSFGVCPQFSAVDQSLSVRNHLAIYGRLKGLKGGMELDGSIAEILVATQLQEYADRPAGKLSGGNQRKLSLAIALIGNPSIILIDEFSTGIDAKTKRDLWEILKVVLADKAVFLTTHSLEEASYLANRVGIMSQRIIALGTPEELEAKNVTYDVHFSCQNSEDLSKVKAAMTSISGARLVDDVANRFEVPIASSHHGSQQGFASVADLFEFLHLQQDLPPFVVARSTLESSFIRIINESKLS